VSLTDPSALPNDDPIRRRPKGDASRESPPARSTADIDELRARVTARQIRGTVHAGSLMLLGVGILMAIAVAAMLVVAW
jgi:hypothetical protein